MHTCIHINIYTHIYTHAPHRLHEHKEAVEELVATAGKELKIETQLEVRAWGRRDACNECMHFFMRLLIVMVTVWLSRGVGGRQHRDAANEVRAWVRLYRNI